MDTHNFNDLELTGDSLDEYTAHLEALDAEEVPLVDDAELNQLLLEIFQEEAELEAAKEAEEEYSERDAYADFYADYSTDMEG